MKCFLSTSPPSVFWLLCTWTLTCLTPVTMTTSKCYPSAAERQFLSFDGFSVFSLFHPRWKHNTNILLCVCACVCVLVSISVCSCERTWVTECATVWRGICMSVCSTVRLCVCVCLLYEWRQDIFTLWEVSQSASGQHSSPPPLFSFSCTLSCFLFPFSSFMFPSLLLSFPSLSFHIKRPERRMRTLFIWRSESLIEE